MKAPPSTPKRRLRALRRGAVVAACAVLAAVAAAGWAHSASTAEVVTRTGGRLRAPTDVRPEWIYSRIAYGVMISPGSVRLFRSEYQSISPVEPDLTPWREGNGWRRTSVPAAFFRDGVDPVLLQSVLDFRVARIGFYRTFRSGESTRTIEAPFWLLIAAAATPPGVMLAGVVRRRRRVRSGRCAACGYPAGAGGVCTECGRGAE